VKKKIVIAGGTGFIGKYLKDQFKETGYEVMIISRSKGDVPWTDLPGLVSALENANTLINLAGKSVDCRYTEKNKAVILRSRTETTRLLGEAVGKCQNPPALWINASTATIYRHAEDRPMTENGGEIGQGFSVDVATSWERSFFGFRLTQTRQVALRMAIVLGKNGGIIKRLGPLVRFGLGGRQGNGKQMFSWIHIADVFGIIRFVMANPELKGVYNGAAPSPVTNEILMKTFREKTHTQIALPSPAWLLQIGAVIIRTETELILKSRWVIPKMLLQAGYIFRYPSLDSALENILNHG
jgi:uncharacterized protein